MSTNAIACLGLRFVIFGTRLALCRPDGFGAARLADNALARVGMGKGLLVAFDLPDGDVRGRVVQECWDRGLAVLSCGPRSIRLRPPLIFSEAQATQVLGTLREVLDDLG